MSIFLFILGLILGFLLKLGFDEYHYYLDNQKKVTENMEDILTRFKAIELLKEK